ncbi:MAG: peptidyl-prolyl cis-trans isomerase [Gammaproteobacteria bacterium]|nr:peptidyl-prolyl cis-trans isomerase [Gammaproteobacteria bacterium]MCK5262199.1 peptidyl-prolyl cis-trans isomerase [Gammaproteobacteria bacterium]
MKKYIFAGLALFLGLGSALLFVELSQTYSTLTDDEATEIQSPAILTDPADMGTIINVKMETSMGEVMLELYPDRAPETVKNFLYYTNAGEYDGTIFHRVIKNFMNQGGGFTTDYKQTEMQRPISNEAFNGLSNLRGTIAMARTSAPHSATKQFFINTADNTFLDHTGKNMSGWGYAVFGKIVSGMDVMNNISNVQTGDAGPFDQDVPEQQIIILKMLEDKSSTEAASTEPLATE